MITIDKAMTRQKTLYLTMYWKLKGLNKKLEKFMVEVGDGGAHPQFLLSQDGTIVQSTAKHCLLTL